MFAEFAIEPAAMAGSLDRFLGLIDRFGVEHGRIISDFAPTRWSPAVIAEAEARDFGEVALATVVERLKEKRDEKGIVRMGRVYPDVAGGWVANARAEDARRPFKAVITEAGGSGCAGDCRAMDVRNDRAPCMVPGLVPVPRVAADIAGVVAPLMAVSRELHLIDPHVTFDGSASTNRRWREPIAALIAGCAPGMRVTVHVLLDQSKPTHASFEQAAHAQLAGRLPAGVRVSLRRWAERPGGEQFHDRAVLSDVGGMTFGHGLDEGGPGTMVHVQRLSRDGWSTLLAKFDPATSPYTPDPEIVLQEVGV